MIPYQGYDGQFSGGQYGNVLYPDLGGVGGDTGGGDHSPPPKIYFKMPRVVPNQREKFDNDEIFKRNSRESEIRYTLFRDRPYQERQAKFQAGCRDGHTEIANSSTGLVLVLSWNPIHSMVGYDNRMSDRIDGVDFHKEPGKAHITASIIVNGVCCRFRGWIDMERLDGIGFIEFDEDMARIEDEILQREISIYNRRFKDLEGRRD